MSLPDHSYAVILAGGGGTRLWPKSRKIHPKHLLNLFGDETMLQLTYQRALSIFPRQNIFIITLNEHVEELLNQIPDVVKENLIVEPEPKNTALAMGVAAAFVYKRDPEAVIINFAADHVIKDLEKFSTCVIAGLEAAKEYGFITAIGIKPTFPHTGLGYIKQAAELKSAADNNGVALYQGGGFKEKPDLATAQRFLDSGDNLWNANIYSWKASTILEELIKQSPEIGKSVDAILEAIGTPNQDEVIKDAYASAPSQQIDTAVSEKVDNMVVIAGDFDWSDVGDWKVVSDMLDKDADGNAVVKSEGDFIGIGNKDILVETDGKLIVGIGLENLAIIDTGDAILIVNKDQTQDVKKVIEQFKLEKKDKYL